MNVTLRTHTLRAAAVAAAAATSLAFVGSASAAAPVVGPSGSSFYTPSSSKVNGGHHGDLIWYRTADSANRLSNAASSYTVLYKSKSLKNKSIAVSGLVYVPKGTAPSGGWPVISWGHGTTGSADICAPSLNTTAYTDPSSSNYSNYVAPQFNDWLAAGYAVVQTDYEGLGTAGIHPYLVGHSEARGMIDIILAARKLAPALSTKWFSSGHSQGGHAALFAAADGPTWAPGLQLKGVAAFAPANNLKTTVVFASQHVTSPDGLSGIGALMLRSIPLVDTSLTVTKLMNPAALALLPQIETKCLGADGLSSPTSFGQFAPGNLLKSYNGSTTSTPWTDANVLQGIRDLDGPGLNPNQVISVPIEILQGKTDGTVPSFTTDSLVSQLTAKNPSTSLTYKTYEGVGHGPVVAAGESDATAFFNAHR
jgi:pimeloyl-ACP methyl ester carboxylesterase